MPTSDQPSLDRLILALLVSVVVMGSLTMFWHPAYEAGFYAIISNLLTVFGGACGAKWGLSQASKQPSIEHPPVSPIPIAPISPTPAPVVPITKIIP